MYTYQNEENCILTIRKARVRKLHIFQDNFIASVLEKSSKHYHDNI